jgi:SAM-dependent methyltransferase
MPDLDTTLHLEMLRDFRAEQIPLWIAAQRGYATRRTLEEAVRDGALAAAIMPNGQRQLKVADLLKLYGRPNSTADIYGSHWGDPETLEPLRFIRKRYLEPLLSPELVGVEIGPGGGRWTRYLAHFRKLYAVDYHQEMLDELARNFDRPNIIRIKNNGNDFPGIGDEEVDLVFSFDAFVHFDLSIVREYLRAMNRIMKPGATGFIHYSDKTKIMARENPGFAENSPETMRKLVTELGYEISIEDTTSIWHSAIVLFKKRQ